MKRNHVHGMTWCLTNLRMEKKTDIKNNVWYVPWNGGLSKLNA